MTKFEREKQIILDMPHIEMCRLYRFAEVGHRYFNTTNKLSEVFSERFKELGGMTTEMSKRIGW